MAFTAANVIERALKRARIVPRSQPVPPNWLDDGRELFNDMLAEWRIMEFYVEPRRIEDDALNTVIALDDDWQTALAYNLSAKLCSAFGFDLPPDVQKNAPLMLDLLMADAKGPIKSDIDPALQTTMRSWG